MHDYTVTFCANWTDARGLVWSTGKQERIVWAHTPEEAVFKVRCEWLPGAEGECTAERVCHRLLDEMKAKLGVAPRIETPEDFCEALDRWADEGPIQ